MCAHGVRHACDGSPAAHPPPCAVARHAARRPRRAPQQAHQPQGRCCAPLRPPEPGLHRPDRVCRCGSTRKAGRCWRVPLVSPAAPQQLAALLCARSGEAGRVGCGRAARQEARRRRGGSRRRERRHGHLCARLAPAGQAQGLAQALLVESAPPKSARRHTSVLSPSLSLSRFAAPAFVLAGGLSVRLTLPHNPPSTPCQCRSMAAAEPCGVEAPTATGARSTIALS